MQTQFRLAEATLMHIASISFKKLLRHSFKSKPCQLSRVFPWCDELDRTAIL
ncbi:hypothetical protein A2U01_0061552, partial [Trifolium medium]|nr:hypothetical protein [Trifolium medium]